MKPSTKQFIAISQEETTNAATATGDIDTIGFNYLSIDVIASTSNAATNNPTVLKISESDDTVVTNFTDIPEFVGDGVSGFTIPDSATSGNWGVKINADLRARKRYLKVSVSPVTTQTITAIGNLSLAETVPTDAASAGVDVLVIG